MKALLLAVMLLAPSVALSQAPPSLGYHGRLLRTDGTAVTGVVSISFELFADASNGAPGTGLWSETQSLALTDGFYSTVLGSQKPIAPSLFEQSSRYLEVAVEGVPLRPRLQMASVPYALSSAVAKSLAAGAPPVVVSTGATLNSSGTTVTGAGTAFTSQLSEGDELIVGVGANRQSRLVVAVASDTSLTTDSAFSPQLVSSTYSYQKPVTHLTDSSRSGGLVVNSRGAVGIGTKVPRALLDVRGDVAIYGRSASLVFNVRSIVSKTSADAVCGQTATAIYVPRSYLGKTGTEICAADVRKKATCAAVRYVFVTTDNQFGAYPTNDLSCASAVQVAWPWGTDYGAPDTLSGEWGHGDTHVVCCM